MCSRTNHYDANRLNIESLERQFWDAARDRHLELEMNIFNKMEMVRDVYLTALDALSRDHSEDPTYITDLEFCVQMLGEIVSQQRQKNTLGRLCVEFCPIPKRQ